MLLPQDIMKVTLPPVASAQLPADESPAESSGRLERWSPGRDSFAQEAIFVPSPSRGNIGNRRGNEDEGWLLAPVFRSATMTTDLVILDAADVAGGPVATIHLPHHIPIGLSKSL
jgi:all-trans-8'-apo-beta-carotenal 15,15'-oxygenase